MKVFCVLLGLLCTLTILPFSLPYLWTALPALAAFSLLFMFFRRKKESTFVITLSIILLAFVLHRVLFIKQSGSYNAPCDKATVVFIEGTLVTDSTYSDSGTLVLTLLLTKVGNSFSNTFEGTTGVSEVVALATERAFLSVGTKVHLTGHFSGDFFIVTSMKVLKKGLLSHVREALILLLEKRLNLNSLGMLLLLGRSEDLPQKITESAAACGCIHVLALSGMHLNILASGVERLFGKNKLSKVLASILVFVFIFIAGPKPSLIRAAIMYFLSFLGADVAVCVAFFLQLVFTPYVFLSLGNAFGYVAVFAILSVSPFIHWYLKSCLGQNLGVLIGTTTGVLILSAPLQLLLDNCWYPQAIFAGPLAAFLAALAMATNLLILIFGPVSFLLEANAHISACLTSIFSFSSSLGSASLESYLVFLGLLILLPLACRIYERL